MKTKTTLSANPNDDKIALIKAYRSMTGCSLREAKFAVEDIMDGSPIILPLTSDEITMWINAGGTAAHYATIAFKHLKDAAIVFLENNDFDAAASTIEVIRDHLNK